MDHSESVPSVGLAVGGIQPNSSTSLSHDTKSRPQRTRSSRRNEKPVALEASISHAANSAQHIRRLPNDVGAVVSHAVMSQLDLGSTLIQASTITAQASSGYVKGDVNNEEASTKRNGIAQPQAATSTPTSPGYNVFVAPNVNVQSTAEDNKKSISRSVAPHLGTEKPSSRVADHEHSGALSTVLDERRGLAKTSMPSLIVNSISPSTKVTELNAKTGWSSGHNDSLSGSPTIQTPKAESPVRSRSGRTAGTAARLDPASSFSSHAGQPMVETHLQSKPIISNSTPELKPGSKTARRTQISAASPPTFNDDVQVDPLGISTTLDQNTGSLGSSNSLSVTSSGIDGEPDKSKIKAPGTSGNPRKADLEFLHIDFGPTTDARLSGHSLFQVSAIA